MTNTPEIISISDDDTPILLDDLPVVVSESKRSVVPIDGKNYDVEITSIISNRNCFGMVKLPIFILYNLDHIVKAYMGVFKNLSNKSIIYFTFPPERGSNLEVKQHLAELNESHSQLLIALVQHNVVFESYLDFRHSVAKMLVYGRKLDASFIGNSFLMAGLTLLPPDVQPKEVYINPQTTLPQMMPRTGANQVPGLLVDQIDQLYKQITRSDNLETAEPSALVTTKLYKYQKQGLFWLKKQESAQEDVFWKKKGLQWEHVVTGTIRHTRPKKFRGGILADDMGLGKTLQMISLLLSSRPSINMEICSDEDELPAPAANSKYEFGFVPLHKSTCKNDDDENIGKFRSTGTLIICPLSLVYNWEQQIIDHSVPGSLKVLVYHGPQRSQDASSFLNYDVVITTYNIIGLNLSKGTSALHQVHWHRIILDEAHVIKSTTAAQSKAAILFKATNRWCLTGTPIQNKLDDLYSLVKFLRISPLDKKSEFSTYITKPANTGKRAAAFKRLQILMKGMTLRRVKTDTINGIPIISLPPKRETVRILSLDKEERTFYDKIHRAGKTLFNDLRDSGAVLKNYATILKAILLMRQACLHQSLPKFIESEFDTNVVLSRLCDLDAEEAKKAFHLLRSIDENTCMKCQSIVEAPGIYVSPCRHLLCCNCRESASKYELIGCGLCGAQTSANQLLQVKDEEEYASDDEMGGMLATSNVNDYGTKIAALVDDIKLVQAEDAMRKGSATKSVIFSQFTKFLSLCERALKESGITFVRLDGSMNRQARSTVLDKFRNDPGMSCFLISIKAGGVGLNLVSASRVYVMEPYWNPAVEQQAIDRVYRLGQTKPVIVIRYLVESSIEMNMQQRQRYKIALAEKALTEDELITENRNKKRKAANDVILNEKIESLSILFR